MSNPVSHRDSFGASSSRSKLAKVPELVPPYVHLLGFHPSQLPVPTANVEELSPLLQSMLTEGLHFLSSLPSPDAPSQSVGTWRFMDTKYFFNSHGAVHMYERMVTASELRNRVKTNTISSELARTLPEVWFLRRSIHQNDAVNGSASWEEFEQCFKDDHAKYEKAYTPTVSKTTRLHEWNCSGMDVEIDGQKWENFTLRREESTHTVPFPLKNRIFPVFQVTASQKGKKEFVIVQVAVRDNSAEMREGGRVLRGAYTSVERIRELDDGQIEWVMGCTSEARGMIPSWVQRKSVPGHLAKDVDMFMTWVGSLRKEKNVIVLK